jgi:hypothetical protein
MALFSARVLCAIPDAATLLDGLSPVKDVARLSPLLHEHINMLGRYSFSMSEAVANGQLRPLRDPNDSTQT